MKLARITTLASLSGITLALALFAGSALTAGGEPVAGKGAAKLLMKPDTTVTSASPKTMSCAKCTDEYVARQDRTARGINKPTLVNAHHLCPGCTSTVATVGQGKAKHDVTTHACTVGAAAGPSCCAQ